MIFGRLRFLLAPAEFFADPKPLGKGPDNRKLDLGSRVRVINLEAARKAIRRKQRRR